MSKKQSDTNEEKLVREDLVTKLNSLKAENDSLDFDFSDEDYDDSCDTDEED